MPWSTGSGVSLHYQLAGQGPTPLVLVHELGGSLESWDEVVPLLSDECRMLRYDQRGAGLSEKVRTPFTITDLVVDLEALVQAVGLPAPFYIAAVAMGAAVAVTYAARAPQQVAGLVLCPPALGVDASRRHYLVERAQRAAQDGMRSVIDKTLEQAYPPAAIRDRDRYDDYRARFLANDPVSYGLANMALADSTSEADVPSVGCRCLLLAGMHDGLRPEEQVRALARRFPDAECEVIDGGHFMSAQAPAALAARIRRFIASP